MVSIGMGDGSFDRAHRNPHADELLIGRESHLTDFGARVGEDTLGFSQCSDDLRVYSVLSVGSVDADANPSDPVSDSPEVVWHMVPQGSWIVGISARDDAEHRSGVCGRAAHRADMIE